MPLQDLTPQLRTRLSRLERIVGWFVIFATLLLLFGLAYYVYQLAERKGWLKTRMPYFTFVRNATGLRVGDRVRLMGFDAGQILEITAQRPEDEYFNVFVQFEIHEPYYGYVWSDSRTKIGAADFLGNRFIEVTKGTNGAPSYADHEIREVTLAEARGLIGGTNEYKFAENLLDETGTNFVVRNSDDLTREILTKLSQLKVSRIQLVNKSSPKVNPPKMMWDSKPGRYVPIPPDSKGYWIEADESPALTERLENVINTVEAALPGFLGLTNKLAAVLTRADSIVSHTDDLLVQAKPIVTNFAQISSQLNQGKGALGEWLLPTNVNQELAQTLQGANKTLRAAETNLSALTASLLLTLENLANTTSNLNAQVQSNTNLVSSLSQAITHSDEFIQGLKRHWLLRSAFKEKKAKEEEKDSRKKPVLRSPRY